MKKKRKLVSTIEPTIPEYHLNGEDEKARKRKFHIPKGVYVTLLLFLTLTLILHGPPFLLRNQTQEADETVMLSADANAVLEAAQYLKDNPDEDFDADGISNEEEVRRETDPYRMDTDGDGITDYAEIYLLDSNPLVYGDSLITLTRQQMEENQQQINSPYEQHNVILWPDDIESRAFGAVVRTLTGYRLCNFRGWAQFPEGSYVYEVKDGIHKELKRNSEGAVYISGPNTLVEAYASSLDMVYDTSFFGQSFYIRNTFVGNLLSFLLPSHGPALASIQKKASIDLDPDIRQGIEVEKKAWKPGDDYAKRFGRNQNTLTDLSRIHNRLSDGEAVSASLFSQTAGESQIIIYGITPSGDLLIADAGTLKKTGQLKITERASRLYNAKGEWMIHEWFTFEGMGFSSEYGDRISFY